MHWLVSGYKNHSRFLVVIGLFMLIFTTRTVAFHIVGGEIELIHLGGFNYRMNLIQYFDVAQEFNPGPEPDISVFTFRKRDRARIRIDTLFLASQNPVLYTNPACAIAQLSTEKVLFTRDITLDPNEFNDPDGYYLVWERCCRSEVVNIVNPTASGMTYVLEFPPIVKDGVPFVNSSPSLFPPLSDFACVGELYYVDFAGVDLDGDSLVYSLAEPLNTSSFSVIPIPQYPDSDRTVTWIEGISNANIIPGAPPLNINSKGFVTVRPKDPGLYVFAALVEEFRDGKKIGEVRRDFQLLVIDGCLPGKPPMIQAVRPDNNMIYVEGDVISFLANQDKCLNFLVRDVEGEENVTLRALGANFDRDVSNLFAFNTAKISGVNDEITVGFCLPKCPLIPGETFKIDFIAMDDACPLPRMDTLQMSFIVESPPNNPPAFLDPDKVINVEIDEGSTTSLVINGADLDPDALDISILNKDFDPARFGMSLSPTTSVNNTIASTYSLDGNCLIHDFGTQNEFQLKLALEDRDLCMVENADILDLNVKVNLPDNADPVVSTSIGKKVVEVSLEELLDFEVFATDADGDEITLEAFGKDFDLSDLGIQFEPETGISKVSSKFQWQFNCDGVDLSGLEEFTVNFVANDNDKCKVPNADTLAIVFKLVFPFNNPPKLSGNQRGDLIEDGDVIDVKVLAPLQLPITGTDVDGDRLKLSIIENEGLPESESFEFMSMEASSEVTSNLNWVPECSLLNSDGSPRDFEVKLVVADDSCPNPKTDTLSITLRIFDSPVTFADFEPPNVLTPNGDKWNEVFSLSGNDEVSFNIPPDSCDDNFQQVTIVNRLGKIVFDSFDRNFVWDATGNSIGTYFYFLTFTNTQYRGILTILD